MARFLRTPSSTLVLAIAVLAAAPTAARAAESYRNCTGFIDTLPATISTQGTWCLRHDLVTGLTSANAILVQTNNVTLDCNDFKLGGLAAGEATQSIGVLAVNRNNVTVRNCNVRGFAYGIKLQGEGSGHVVEDNRLIANTTVGIHVSGDGAVVRGNQVTDTGGSSVNLGQAAGIQAYNAVFLIDNLVSGVTPRPTASGNGNAYGIQAIDNGRAGLKGNRVRGLLSQGAGTANALRLEGDGSPLVQGNDVAGAGAGIGIRCVAHGVLRDNTVVGFSTATSGCTSVD